MNDFVVFENAGVIDPRMISTFGCSVKESSNPIGFFGTGLKYAIAVLLRTGHKVTIQSGLNQFEAVVKSDTLRGKEFRFVFLDDVPLGFTTELGKTWEVWMAYRELFCNAKDEPESQIYCCSEIPDAHAEKTRVIVSGEAFLAAHRNQSDFILEGTPEFILGDIEVYHKPGRSFFYKGIKVMQFGLPCLYTYNQTSHVDLTEDRTVKEPFQVAYKIAREILTHAPASLLKRVLIAESKFTEHLFDFHGWSGHEPSNEFFPAVRDLQRDNVSKINASALRLWREKGQGYIDPRRINPTKIQAETLERAIEFCEHSGFRLRDEFPIIIVETLGAGTLAMADQVGREIFITEQVFQAGGTKGVASALIEEYLHLKFRFTDCSREMQTYLFEKMVSLAEELTGKPL